MHRGSSKPIRPLRIAALVTLLSVGCQGRFVDLWWTADQQGQRAFNNGEFSAAAENFENPMWKATSYYRAGAFSDAADWFSRVDTEAGWFGLGNSLANQELWEDSAAAFRKALELRSEWPEAKENLALVQARIPAKTPDPKGGDMGADLGADDFSINEEGEQQEGGELMEIAIGELTDEQIDQLWMRRVGASPAEFLRWKFAVQAAKDSDGAKP